MIGLNTPSWYTVYMHINLISHRIRSILLLLTSFWLAGCSSSHLSVRTEYLSRESLASYYADTPDPQLEDPPIGQRLIISWCVPRAYLAYPDLHLRLIVRLHNREEISQLYAINQLFGTYVYEVEGKDYLESGGITTYKVDLMTGDTVLDEWEHPLWVELITFPQSVSTPQSKTD